ncbi:MAG: hypothetical protein IIB74_10600 [Proteobacteria bacterium]|nr:hypothetical protein [Pseudomonadota bacterium]
MSSSDDLVSAAYDYLSGRRAFADLYAIVAEADFRLFSDDPEGLPSRLSGAIMLAEGEEAQGAHSPGATRERIADVLREAALESLASAGS